MNKEYIESLLSRLSDDPDDFEFDRAIVQLKRQGKELQFSLTDKEGVGCCVETVDPNGLPRLVPLKDYVQSEILGLPRLARQIDFAITKKRQNEAKESDKKIVPYIAGPGSFSNGTTGMTDNVANSLERLSLRVNQPDPGATQVIQLMAPAGQGKTMLLEELALKNSRGYHASERPIPLLLHIDLLGRFVGSISDAIAGTLNNTFNFRELNQRDVILCIREGWIALALDGFDELVARIGTRDAFIAISRLIEELEGTGTIILSARDGFFSLYQIEASIRSYLEPKKRGTYFRDTLALERWSSEQGVSVFRHLGSQSPTEEMEALETAFQDEVDMLRQPFFLIRLATMWVKGERFIRLSDTTGRLARINYVIETFIERESKEKWKGREGAGLLDPEGHNAMLASVAEFMWESSAFRLQLDELQLAAGIGIARLNLPAGDVDNIRALVPTHAVLLKQATDSFTFRHDQFLYFFLGYAIKGYLAARTKPMISKMLAVRELSENIIEWVVWHIAKSLEEAIANVTFLAEMAVEESSSTAKSNLAALLAELVPLANGYSATIEGLTFSGSMLAGKTYTRSTFRRCEFWSIELSGTSFEACRFEDCTFGTINVDNLTSLKETTFTNWVFSDRISLVEEDRSLYSPSDKTEWLKKLGASLPEPPSAENTSSSLVNEDAVNAVDHLVRFSARTWDVSKSDLRDKVGDVALSIIDIGLATGILREWERGTSGPRQEFVRFQVNREILMRGLSAKTGVASIDSFWQIMSQKHPRKQKKKKSKA